VGATLRPHTSSSQSFAEPGSQHPMMESSRPQARGNDGSSFQSGDRTLARSGAGEAASHARKIPILSSQIRHIDGVCSVYCESNISHPRYQPSGERGNRPSPLAF
jgi:hypothetical protein